MRSIMEYQHKRSVCPGQLLHGRLGTPAAFRAPSGCRPATLGRQRPAAASAPRTPQSKLSAIIPSACFTAAPYLDPRSRRRGCRFKSLPVSRIRLLRCSPVTAAISSNKRLLSFRLAGRYRFCIVRRYFRRSLIVIGSSLDMVPSVTFSFE